ncbi:MAG: hypothetical protein WD771_10000 [Gemmatimonadaceae bacterium]
MTAPANRVRHQESKRLHVVLRDGTLLEGSIFIAEDMSLVSFLGSRKGGFMNMVDARRPKLEEAPGHLIVQTDLVVLVSAPDSNVQVVSQGGAGAGEREVDVYLIGGKGLRGVMYLAPMQRMSDYLHHCGKFAGIAKAVFIADGAEVGDVAVNTAAIAMIREARPPEEQPTG